MTLVKICGLTTPEVVDAAVEAGADYLGFAHFPPSPRHLELDRIAALMARAGPARSVILLVDPSPTLLAAAAALGPDLIQLHGRETPADVEAARALGVPVIKAVPVGGAADVAAASAYPADHLMFDAKPPKGADRPGGHGAAFDWTLLSDVEVRTPWFLAGGLTPANVAEALRITRAPVADVSSGVERAPGVKDPALIAAFIQAVRAYDAEVAAQQEQP
jgi:phosphoribosylanthranilate isomerase